MFRKMDFLEIARSPLSTGVAVLQYSVCNATKNELLTKFLKRALKLTENVLEVISTEVPFTDLQTIALCVFKALKVTSMVEFLSSEAGANRFSTE